MLVCDLLHLPSQSQPIRNEVVTNTDTKQAGSVVVSWVSSPLATWTCLITLLTIHLLTNRAAVRAVSMTSLNRQRANILASEYLSKQKVLTPLDVSARERIFEWDGVLRWRGGAPIGRAKIGGSIVDLLKQAQATHPVTGAIRDGNLLPEIVEAFKGEGYLMWYHMEKRTAHICLKVQSSPQDQIKAWVHALWTAYRLHEKPLAISASSEDKLRFLQKVLAEVNRRWKSLMEQMEVAGWDVNSSSIETASGLRFHLQSAL